MPTENSLIPLSDILHARHASQTAVAINDDGFVTGRRLVKDVCAAADALVRRPEKRWALYCVDSYEFLVGLLGLLHADKTLILIPNVQKNFLRAIAGSFDAILCDFTPPVSQPRGFLLEDMKTSPARDLQSCSCRRATEKLQLPEIELFTSGSTGTPKKIEKRVAQLENEVEALEATWGKGMVGSTVLATVSHQHIYGLLFRVLWPVMAGRCFDSRSYTHPEQLFEQIQSRRNSVLISSPAWLTRISARPEPGAFGKRLSAIFSSGGPLDKSSVVSLTEKLNLPITEIFGSSETGGVGYRIRTKSVPEPPWKPLPRVSVDVEPELGCLMVRSPYTGRNDWHVMSDTARINGAGEFRLSGRRDKIVKIEEKRLSLTEMEAQLLDSELVKEAAATVQSGTRDLVAVIAVLSDMGCNLLARAGKRAVNESLKKHLSDYFEPVMLPRKWRYTDSLPTDSQGKISHAALQQLMGMEMITKPKEKILKKSSRLITLEMTVPHDLYYFKGHFDGMPLLPGVVQIDWVMAWAEKYLGVLPNIARMEAVKFSKPIEPGYLVRVTVELDEEKNRLTFSYESHLGGHSSGKIVLDESS